MNLLDIARAAIRNYVATELVRATEADAYPAMATPEQAAELRDLVAVFLDDDTEQERAEAITRALSDPDAALTSFRLLAEEYLDRHAYALAREASIETGDIARSLDSRPNITERLQQIRHG